MSWYAAHIMSMRQKAVVSHFKDNGVEVFVPMERLWRLNSEGRRVFSLRPVVRNLVFFKETADMEALRSIVLRCTEHIRVFCKAGEKDLWQPISDEEMADFQLMCNPELELRQFVSPDDDIVRRGEEVRVCFGPLKGVTGRLVRRSGKYYVLKEVPGTAVMLKVSRWCCKKRE